MKYTNCPTCGVELNGISTGWICPICHCFIDMQGNIHPYEEKSFTPPRTNADKIRAMPDEELAEWIKDIQDNALDAEGNMYGLHYPEVDRISCETEWIEWLRQPVKENT